MKLEGYIFELAKARNQVTGEYCEWGREQFSFDAPCVPEGSIRNLRPVYSDPNAIPFMKETTLRDRQAIGRGTRFDKTDAYDRQKDIEAEGQRAAVFYDNRDIMAREKSPHLRTPEICSACREPLTPSRKRHGCFQVVCPHKHG